MLDSDLDVLFSGPDAVPVTTGASSFKGLFDCPDSDEGMMISTGYVLTVKTSDVQSSEEETEIIVDGVNYTLLKQHKIDEGKLSKVYLNKV